MTQTALSPTLYSVSSALDVIVDETEKNNQSLLPVLEKTIKGEDGNIYVSSSGVLKFVPQQVWAETRSAVSQATFTDTGTGVYYDHASLRMAFDADLVRNNIKVAGSFNLVGVSNSASSVSSVGVASDSIETSIAFKVDADTLANYLVTIYKNPKLRVEPFMVKGQRNPATDFPTILSLELLDRFTFKRTPSVGSAIVQDMLLQSIEHRITPNTWETVINGSARFTGFFIIGVSLIGGTDVLL